MAAAEQGGSEKPGVRFAEVGVEQAGERLDKAVPTLLPGLSRSLAKGLIKRGQLRVNGKAVKPSHVLVAGDRVEADLRQQQAAARRAVRAVEIPVLHEDDHLVVIDKPAGVAAHPNSPRDLGTVAQWAQDRYGPLPCPDDAQERPGIVHRLDRFTSGVMVLARTQEALAELKAQFRRRLTDKRYLAIVYGVPPFASDWVERQIARDALHPERMRVVDEGGRESSTFWELLEDYGRWALLGCKLETGRTHQIRVHLASIGHALLADRVYRSANTQRHPLPPEAPILDRHALHAASLTVAHPATQERVTFEAPLPADLTAMLAWLREGAG